MGEILIPRRTKVEKGYELLADITVGTATTSVDITGLNIGKGDEVVLVGYIGNYGTSQPVGVFINDNNTKTNYYRQRIEFFGTSIAGSRVNNSSIANTYRGNSIIANIKLTNSGYFICQSSTIHEIGLSTMFGTNNYVTSTFTASSITKLSIISDVSNSIVATSRFQLYKIGGA